MAAAGDAKQLKKLLSASVMETCNKTIIRVLQDKIWNDPSILSLVLAHVNKAVDQAHAKTYNFVDERHEYLVAEAGSSIQSATNPARYEFDTMEFYRRKAINSALLKLIPNLADEIEKKTQTLCQQLATQSQEFTWTTLRNLYKELESNTGSSIYQKERVIWPLSKVTRRFAYNKYVF